MEKKKRGRPRNSERPKIAAADQIIGRTIHRLSMWGYPLRGERGIFQVVADEAQGLGLRKDERERALGEDLFAKIYESWRDAERDRRSFKNWKQGTDPEPVLQERWRYEVHYLASARPYKGWSLRRYAKKLLQMEGVWRFSEKLDNTFCYSRQLKLTPKAEKNLILMPQFAKRKTG
jgi:hypothetical protein